MFADRTDAGQRLAKELSRFNVPNPCVLALPRGGVPVAFEIAKLLQAPLDLLIVRKLGAPGQAELAIGAVADGQHPALALNDDIVAMLQVSEAYIAAERARQIKEIERRRKAYLAGRPRVDFAGRTAIVVDDGIATGATIRAGIISARRAGPERLVLAVPVAPVGTIAALRPLVDDIVCLESHVNFHAISLYYAEFPQVGDDEVKELLSRAMAWLPHSPHRP